MRKLILLFVEIFILGTLSMEVLASEDSLRRTIRESFYDPDAVKFGRIVIKDARACAEVNGKNRYGAYVGKQVAMAAEMYGKWYLVGVKDMTINECFQVIREAKEETEREAEVERERIKEEQEEKARTNIAKMREIDAGQTKNKMQALAQEDQVIRREKMEQDLANERNRLNAEKQAMEERTQEVEKMKLQLAADRAKFEAEKVTDTIPVKSDTPLTGDDAQGQGSKIASPMKANDKKVEAATAIDFGAVLECAGWLGGYVAVDANLATRIEKDEWDETGFFAKYNFAGKMNSHPLRKMIEALGTKGGGEAALTTVIQQSVTPEINKILLQVEGDNPGKKKGQRVAIALPIVKQKAEEACEKANEKGIRIITISNLNAVKM